MTQLRVLGAQEEVIGERARGDGWHLRTHGLKPRGVEATQNQHAERAALQDAVARLN